LFSSPTNFIYVYLTKNIGEKLIDDYVVVDIETTGLSKRRHQITELAAVKVKDGEVKDEFQSLVNPGVHIPSFITRLTGIDDDMVAKAKPINKILPRFLRFMGSRVMIAHNATFDYGFLNHNAEQHLDRSFTNERLCTCKLTTRLLPSLPSRRLAFLCEHFNVVNDQAHRAMADAQATYKIFLKFQDMMVKHGFDTSEKVFKLERSPPAKFRNVILNGL